MIVEFGIFNLMGARDPRTPTSQVLAEVVEKFLKEMSGEMPSARQAGQERVHRAVEG